MPLLYMELFKAHSVFLPGSSFLFKAYLEITTLYNGVLLYLDGNAQHISENFFNHALNPPSKMTMRIFGNIIVKLLYIISNVLAFILTDIVLNGRFPILRYRME